jgi:CRP/FNR family cyclic AMP-dependent transcriptional regulator
MTFRQRGRAKAEPEPVATSDGAASDIGQRVDLFGFLDEPATEDFVASAGSRVVPAGQRIYTQDDRHRVMYRIVSGRAWLSYSRADGRELLYMFLGPGECFGISGLVDGHGLPQSATARTDVTLQVISHDTFERLRRRHACFDDAIMRSILRDVRIMISYLAEAALDDLPARVARRLLALALPDSQGRLVVDLPQSELAAVFGVSRQTLNRVLRDLESEGLVQLGYGTVALTRPAELADRANRE